LPEPLVESMRAPDVQYVCRMTRLALDPRKTALVVIDLQQGIVARDTTPHASRDVVAQCARLAKKFRELKATVALVRVAFSADGRDRLSPRADAPAPSAPMAPNWAEIVPELGPESSDLVVIKRQWGAFYGTDLDLQLRRRGVGTIVIGGISTNFGVESTARNAYELGYDLVFVEDGMSGLTEGAHSFAITTVFPRIGIVRSAEQVIAALS
jgi:nicotinamidase-related amidase